MIIVERINSHQTETTQLKTETKNNPKKHIQPYSTVYGLCVERARRRVQGEKLSTKGEKINGPPHHTITTAAHTGKLGETARQIDSTQSPPGMPEMPLELSIMLERESHVKPAFLFV